MVGPFTRFSRRPRKPPQFRVAQRYTASFSATRERLAKKPPKDQKQRAARVLAELAAGVLDNLDALDEELLDHGAFLFEDLVEEDVAGDALLGPAKRMREHVARARRGWSRTASRVSRAASSSPKPRCTR